MPNPDEKIAQLVSAAARDERVLAVLLFGSRARGEAAPSSDVDLCVVLDPARADAKTAASVKLTYLESTPGAFDIQVYQGLPIYVRKRVLGEGKVVYCRDDDALYALARRTIREFEDFRPRYQYYLEEVARAGS
jgi:predicted nucleotidyltransferase